MAKFELTIEDGLTQIKIDGQQVGLIAELRLHLEAGKTLPTGEARYFDYLTSQMGKNESLELLRRLPWLKLDVKEVRPEEP